MKTPSNSKRDIWERWRPAWHGLFGVLIVGALTFTFLDPEAPPDVAPPILALTFVLIAWYIAAEVRFGLVRRESVFPVFAYFVTGWIQWFILVNFTPAFFLLLFFFFPYGFMRLPLNWAIASSLILNALVLITIGRIDSDLASTWMLVTVGTSLSGGLLAYFIDAIIRQSEERQRLIAELEATRETLAKSEYEAGILNERGRLAGELHDTIIQGLIAIVTQLEAAENADDDSTRAHHIARAKVIAREDIQEARRFIWTTEDSALSAEILNGHLRSMIQRWTQTTAIPCELHITGDTSAVSVPHQVAHTLFRVTQEALSNVGNHARGTRATVTLSLLPDVIVLDVNDDGIGFTPARHAPDGFGVENMRRRVEALGGTFTIESEPGAGTTVVAELPLSG